MRTFDSHTQQSDIYHTANVTKSSERGRWLCLWSDEFEWKEPQRFLRDSQKSAAQAIPHVWRSDVPMFSLIKVILFLLSKRSHHNIYLNYRLFSTVLEWWHFLTRRLTILTPQPILLQESCSAIWRQNHKTILHHLKPNIQPNTRNAGHVQRQEPWLV
jgi:hypothetical protein